MLLGQSSESIFPENENFIIYLLQTGHYAQAYDLLLQATKQKVTTASLFNLALCFMEAEEYMQALAILDQAQSSLRLPLGMSNLRDNVYLKLSTKQNRASSYKLAVNSLQIDLFPDLIYENILRLRVDCFLLTEQWKPLMKIAVGLRNKQYRNVEEAIRIAEQNLKNETI